MLSPLTLPINTLSINLVKQLSNQHTDNVVISPFSISTAMSMVMLGARNETEEQLFNGLTFNKSFDSSSQVHDQFKSLLNHLKFNESSEDLQLKIANFLLIQEDDSPEVANYTKEVDDKYQAKAESVNFVSDGPKIKDTINTWVSNKTNHKIPTMIQVPPEPDVFMILLNAVYFKGKWRGPFQKSNTKDGMFYNEGTTEVQVSMMHKFRATFYVSDKMTIGKQSVKMISLPYEKDLEMIVILPDHKEGLKQIQDFKHEELETGLKEMKPIMVNLSFPKFRIEMNKELKESLVSIGIRDAFSTNSNLSGINGKRNLYVSSVIHKTFIEVNEEGTEATGATYVEITMRSMPMGKPVEFVVDHPFLFFIRDKTTGVFVFSGSINKL